MANTVDGKSKIIYGTSESETLRAGEMYTYKMGLSDDIYVVGAYGFSGYQLEGKDGDDTLFGGDGRDDLYGGSGNDSFSPGLSNDFMDGGEGLDVADYSSISLSSVSIAFTYFGKGGKEPVGHHVNTNSTLGDDVLVSVERLLFSDKKVALDVTDNALETLQFIGVIAPSLQGNLNVRGTILSLFDQGKTMQEMSQLALDLGLITSDNTALAKTVFKNVFNTTADPDQYLTNTLVSFIEENGDATFIATVAGLNINVDLVGLQQHGMEFI